LNIQNEEIHFSFMSTKHVIYSNNKDCDNCSVANNTLCIIGFAVKHLQKKSTVAQLFSKQILSRIVKQQRLENLIWSNFGFCSWLIRFTVDLDVKFESFIKHKRSCIWRDWLQNQKINNGRTRFLSDFGKLLQNVSLN